MSADNNHPSNKHRTAVGLFIQDIGFRLHLGAAKAAQEQDVNLYCFLGEMCNSPDPLVRQANIAYELVDPHILDALAIWGGSGAAVGMNLNLAEMDQFIQHYSPLPIVNYERKVDGIPVILTDVYQGMCEAVRHLIEIHQRQRIALIWGPAGHFETDERVRAYHDMLAEYKLLDNPNLVSDPVTWSSEGGEEAMEELIRGRGLIPGKDYDAVLTTDSSQAVGALNVLQRYNIHVPDDVAILGFDERDDSRLTTPPLTTVKKPFFEVGKRLVEMAIDCVSGKTVPDITHAPTQLLVRRSCGCIDPAIAQASLDKTQASQEKFDIIINSRRAGFLAEIDSGMQAAVPHADPDGIHQMVENFIMELAGEVRGGFARALEDFLHRETTRSDRKGNLSEKKSDGADWQNMISSMQRRILPYLDGKKRAFADTLWNQARISIGETAQRLQAYHEFVYAQQMQILREIEANLSTAFNLDTLVSVLTEGLPRLGIHSGYLSLYENANKYDYLDPAPIWSRLILALREDECIELQKDGVRFRTRQLTPEGWLLPEHQYNFLVIPLYYRDEQLGFLLLEIGPEDETIYRTLQIQIASALHGISLIKRIEDRALRLEAAAEVSRAASNILNPDELIHKAVELIRERFNLYYVGLFLLDEEGRYARLCAGTGEAGNRMVTQEHRLGVGGNSMIGWCIANQQARIALDVGIEPMRFENPLLPDTRSELALPLLARGMAIGALSVQSDREAAFTDNDIAILQSMADQLANAIENTRLIKARQQAEDALRESELLYTSLVKNMNFNVFRKDLAGRYTYANEAFCRSMNSTLVKLLGKTDYDFSPKETADKYRRDDAKVIASGKPLEVIEEHLLTEDLDADRPATTRRGSGVRYIQTLKAPVRNIQEEIIGIQGAFWDISDRRIAEIEAERHAIQLQTASEVSRAASSLLDVNELTQQAVDLICNRFNLYYVGMFLVDQNGAWTGEPGRWAVLRAGTGEAGPNMISQGHKLEIGGASMIGWCVSNARSYIILDTTAEADDAGGKPLNYSSAGEKTPVQRFKNPLLPDTRSEIALPLTSRGQVLGALSIQSTSRNAFTDEDVTILQSMADQLANAIANASLYEQTQSALREMETIYHRYLVRGWSEYSQTRSASGYRKSEHDVTPLGSDLLPEVQQVMDETNLTPRKAIEDEHKTLIVPIKLRDFPIGAIGLTSKEGQRHWSEDEISLIETLSEQFALAAENLRLLEETQRRAEREHLVSEITTKLRLSNDPLVILQTAASELRHALNARNARIRIASAESRPELQVIGNGVEPNIGEDDRGEL